MSKDGEDLAADAQRRKRRKAGGLRVPSDNVPRPSSQPGFAASSDDPRLAVSVAYAFSDEDGESRERNDRTIADEGERVAEPVHDSVDIDLDDIEEEGAQAAAGAVVAGGLDDDERTSVSTVDELSRPDSSSEVRRATSEPSGKAAGKARAASRWPRVQTESLSDADLENMVVETNPPSEPPEYDDDEQPTQVSEPDHSRPDTVEPETIRKPFGEPGVPTIIAELEEKGAIAAPTSEVDSGDSGEILSEDLVEELADQDSGSHAAAAGDDGADSAGPGQAKELPGVEVGEAAESEARADEAAGHGADGADKPKNVPPPAPKGAASVAATGPATTSRRRKGKPWFEEIFDEDYLRTLPFLTPQSTRAEAGFVIESLATEPGAQLLDVGCGYGRHAMELAARGYHVVGLDSSLPLLLRGADEAQRRALSINFVHGDMRELSFDSQFDGAYCLFSTFGYFDDETNKRTAQNISKALKPGARFVIEVLNRDYIIGDLPSRVWWEGDGCVVLEEVEFNYFSSRILSHRSVVFDDGRQLEQEISIRAYSLHELGKLLHAAGFRVIEVSGGMHSRGRFFGGRSRDIVVVAERRQPKDRSRARTEADV